MFHCTCKVIRISSGNHSFWMRDESEYTNDFLEELYNEFYGELFIPCQYQWMIKVYNLQVDFNGVSCPGCWLVMTSNSSIQSHLEVKLLMSNVIVSNF